MPGMIFGPSPVLVTTLPTYMSTKEGTESFTELAIVFSKDIILSVCVCVCVCV